MTLTQRITRSVLILPICFIFFISSCVHEKNEPIIGLSELSSPYTIRSSTHAVIKLNYYDIVPYLSKKGLVWDPFILPVLENYSISESDLLIGYLEEKDNFIIPPQNGSCKILQKGLQYEGKSKKLYSFASAGPHPEEEAGSLFLLLDYKDLSPFALVKLNKQGEANCYLPNLSYRVSYNFGSHRKEFLIGPEEKNYIKIDFDKKGAIRVESTRENNVKNGDLIRIGRKFETNNDILNNNNNFIPTRIDNDIFNPSNFLSQDLGVDETFRTSVLVGQIPFSIRLQEGKYIIAVVRKNTLICQKEININEGSFEKIECPIERIGDAENRIFSRNQYNIKFDATFFPERLNQEAHFQNWFLSQNKIFMPILNSESKNNLEEKNYSFLFNLLKLREVRKFPEDFSLKVNDTNSPYPIFGTGFENIVQGASPFFNFTSFSSQYSLEPKNILFDSYLEGTNGAEIKIFEPYLEQNGVLMSPDEQRFRVRITVPRWNSTNVVEMYVNGKLQRRWILNRGELAEPFSLTLDEKTFQDKNFTVRFIAWGEVPFPDFLYGVDNYMPFARSRDYSVKILGK